MAVTPFTDAKVYVAQYNLSGDSNKVQLEIGPSEKTCTVFGDVAERVRGGLGTTSCAGEGYMSFGTPSVNAMLRGTLAVADVPMTIAPSGADGEYAEFFKAEILRYTPGAKVGEYLGFKFEAKGQGDLPVQGTILKTGAVTVTGTGVPRQLGILGATQRVCAALHVIAVSGTSPTLTMKVETDNAVGFPTGIIRLTFAQMTGPGSQYVCVNGPIAVDDWWRAEYTVGGTGSPSFTVVLVVGFVNNASA